MADAPTVLFADVKDSNQAASAAFVQGIRQTLQRAQEITQAVSEAEAIADEAAKFCESIKAQHNVPSKKTALTGARPAPPPPPLAASLTREIQTSVVWTQTMLQMCTVADGAAPVEQGQQLSFVRAKTAPEHGVDRGRQAATSKMIQSV
eukprot:CAMPEP_0198538740 /NCGR_PEP_ID=MMETSP1462-20131121/48035_1 /TAXON_ID=1333877 /ORGANISM="Brandtodinium nutriculum, Strain RCC3387" /LENGTH=148 /DNA_ID=CAMNT_0044268773 /DNA_START=66 /DNA_END=510 /DNA_ORIENTATION=-